VLVGKGTKSKERKKGNSRQNDRDKDKRAKRQSGRDNNSPGPSRGLMCEDSKQSPIINPIG